MSRIVNRIRVAQATLPLLSADHFMALELERETPPELGGNAPKRRIRFAKCQHAYHVGAASPQRIAQLRARLAEREALGLSLCDDHESYRPIEYDDYQHTPRVYRLSMNGGSSIDGNGGDLGDNVN